jgi:hypothetical protein
LTDVDIALVAPPINTNPGPEYAPSKRLFQGIPGIERDPRTGRLWALWYCNGTEAREGPDNYTLLVTSGDDGATWSDAVVVIDPTSKVRSYDPCLWTDPAGRLWLFWAQSYEWWDGRSGTWCIVTSNPGDEHPDWTEPRRVANGIMMNKPTVLSNGEWHLPTACWATRDFMRDDMAAERFSNVVVSTDDGKTFQLRGGADVPERTCDEHMVVERQDGSLWMLVRCGPGIGESVSTDGGKTWSPGEMTDLPSPGSRFFIRRLKSGRLLFVSHDNMERRDNLTAWLSEDDGATWLGGLILDERLGVSYPDGIEDADGLIRVIYDRNRVEERDILIARFREADVLEGELVSPDAALRQTVSSIG